MQNPKSKMQKRLYILYFTFCICILLLAACGGAGTSVEKQTVDGITFALEQPRQVALLDNYEYTVTLTDAAGKPIDGAQVSLEQDMPAMPMNSNRPLGEPLGDGRYRITGVFTMEGDWIVKIHARVAGKEYVATFDQQVAPQ
jgi:nitrogen fixation protein FixH